MIRVAAVLGCLALAACATPQRTVAIFECPVLGDVIVRHGDSDAIITMAGRDYALPREMAASGVRYQKGDAQFWEHQGEAFIDLDGRHYHGCKHNPARKA